MKVSEYIPIFRGILYKAESVTQSKGGIYLPSSSETINKVVAVGKGCTDVEIGDELVISGGVRVDVIPFDDGDYQQVMEMQVLGVIRKKRQEEDTSVYQYKPED